MPRQTCSRRRLLLAALSLPAAAACPPALAAGQRRLSFHHTHTGEYLDLAYMEAGRYLPEALAELNQLLRDFRSGEVHPIDPGLFDLLYALRSVTGNARPFEIISGYRSPQTNEMLRRRGGGVARHSLHLEGRAIDIRLPGTGTARLRDAAASLRRGGVGYYPRSDFIHVDTGRVRYW
ncbi:MAG: DUF882 domain-containing protein [Gammaproteobacteria bacterium]|nr:MAG: DUF882 domain-containing protein [Gammaproteobacteria bacterium]